MKKYTPGIALAGFLMASAAIISPTIAHATPTLITIGGQVNGGMIQNMGNDGGTGFVSVSNTMLGSFTLASATATGYPQLPQPDLNTASIDVNSSASGTLTMFITQQNLTTPQGINNFLSSFTFNLFGQGGIASVTEETFISTSNALFGGTLLSSVTDSSGGLSASAKTAYGPAISGPFSETIEYIITATGAGSTNDTVNLSVVPEPASFGLLGAGLGLMMLVAYRRRAF